MKRRDLIIDTQFSEADSTDIRQNQDESKIDDANNSYLENEETIINYMILDLYSQGITKVQQLIETTNNNLISNAFNMLKHYSYQINQRVFNHIRSKDAQLSHHYQRNKNRITTNCVGRQHSQSVDKMNLINDIADRIIETKRIKSQSKHSSNSYISNKEGKRIMSKLDKLQRMIKDIRRQNQMSNQASVVYFTKNRYPEQFIQQDRLRRRIPIEEQSVIRPRGFTPARSPIHEDHYQVFSAPYQRYHTQVRPESYQPFTQSNAFQDRYQRINPPYDNFQHQYFEDRNLYSSRRINPPQKQNNQQAQYYQNKNRQQQSQIYERQPDINEQVQQIKQQLNQLKKMNAQYLNKNNIIEQEARVKKKYSYQNELPQRIDRKQIDVSKIKKEKDIVSKQQTRHYPLISRLDIRGNARINTPQNQPFKHKLNEQRFLTDRSDYPYNGYVTCKNEFLTQKQHRTPLYIKQSIKESSGWCGQCGCRCHDHQYQQSNFRCRGYQS